MLQNIDKLLEEAGQFKAETKEEIEQFRIRYLGKKGALSDLFKNFKEVPAEQKKEVGQKINQLKQFVSDKIDALLAGLSDDAGTGDARDHQKDRPVKHLFYR